MFLADVNENEHRDDEQNGQHQNRTENGDLNDPWHMAKSERHDAQQQSVAVRDQTELHNS